MKNIYVVNLNHRLGELWFDEHYKPLKLTEGIWNNQYDFIIKSLNGKLVEISGDVIRKNTYLKLIDSDYVLEQYWKIIQRDVLGYLAKQALDKT